MLTVGGGRKIRFNIFLQSFSQLESKYGREGAENIFTMSKIQQATISLLDIDINQIEILSIESIKD